MVLDCRSNLSALSLPHLPYPLPPPLFLGMPFYADVRTFAILPYVCVEGITYGNGELVVSDGSSTLHFWDVKTFKEIRRVSVVDEEGKPVPKLNELEYIPSQGLVLVRSK